MTQIFHPATNTFAKVSIFGALFFVAGFFGLLDQVQRSPYYTGVNVAREQPIQFSHSHHVGDVGLDCRYCHTTVEKSAFAGIPATQICIGCHSQILKDATYMQPIHESFRTKEPIRWNRVHDLADFAYFDHSIHVAKGVACVTCHGPIAEMPLTWKANTLRMQWCLDCHRNPDRYVGRKEDVFSPAARPIADEQDRAAGEDLVKAAHIGMNDLTRCSVCHR